MSFASQVGLRALVGVCALAACTTTPEQEVSHADAQAVLNAEIGVRQGETVSRICPRGDDGWRALDDNRVLLEAQGEWYLAELSGTCDPDTAFGGIATRSGPGSTCLARGDRVSAGRPRSSGRCFISALYKWDDDAEVAHRTVAKPAQE